MPRAAKRRQARNFRHLPLPRFAFALLAANGVLASANRTTSWNGRFPCLGQSPRTQRVPPKSAFHAWGLQRDPLLRKGSVVAYWRQRILCLAVRGRICDGKPPSLPQGSRFAAKFLKLQKPKTARRKPVRRFFDAFSMCKARGARTAFRAAQPHRESPKPSTQAALRFRTGKPHTPKRLRQDRHAAFPPLRQMRLAAELSLSP